MNKNEHAAAAVPQPREAIAWLKESGKLPDLSVTWDVAEDDNPAVLDRMAQILFSPPSGGNAA